MTTKSSQGPGISWPTLLVGMGLILPLLGILFSGLFHDPHDLGNPLEDKAAPRFSLPVLDDGKLLSLKDLNGRPAVINFWATWCQS